MNFTLLRGRHSRQNYEERHEPIQEKNCSTEAIPLSTTENEEIEDLKNKLHEMEERCQTLEDSQNVGSATPVVPFIDDVKCHVDAQKEMEELELTNKRLEKEKSKLQQELNSKEAKIKHLREEIEKQDELFSQQQAQHVDILKNLSAANRAKVLLTARLADQEKKIYELEQSLELPISVRIEHREELKVVKEAISCLRLCFAPTDPYQHTLDTIEQSLASLLERVNALEEAQINPQMSKHHNGEFHNTSGHGSQHSPDEVVHNNPQVSYNKLQDVHFSDRSRVTKVVYYTEKSTTPFLSIIPKRIGDISLGDFKMLFNRSGNFRYHFKTFDKEYGAIKEEVLHDDEILPSWDGKIIAWIEEDLD
ncbi:dixin-A-like isoform X2 [Limulus polyphemus]|uniref:Dixin-A-like isoform X2 n=1 Tax=Limulus polyphemus TaxID=6850 RepID=A0ABM1SYC5_LIMPO|nr:dixin-A-like isoform X2 [Limulus polyphemus]